MSYQTPLTIENVIKNIDEKKYLLPSIQREFVWSTKQIEKLFDSLLMDYPISSFLFWEVPKEKVHEFKFYEFLREYHEKNARHNPKANINGNNDIIAILDGQQRLTSLYIGLKGTYAYKLPRKHYDNLQAYPKRKLYLNLLSKSEIADSTYNFLFLTEREVEEENNDIDKNGDHINYWFPVGEILNMEQEYEVNSYLIDNVLDLTKNKDQKIFANETLFKLFSVIHRRGIINYYLEQSTELDKILNIFIRVNSGGTELSYSDLLLSFAISQWEKKDAREEINQVVDEINAIGRGFNINKDLILKTCLVLEDFKEISFKVDNFSHSNMIKIEQDWDDLTNAIRLAVNLIASFGFSRENITSNYSFIPIAYYIKSIGSPSNFIDSSKYQKDRQNIKKWFISSLLLRVFSFAPDGVLKPIRDIIKENPGEFPLTKIIERFKGTNRDITFTEDSIDNLLWIKYGSRDILLVLSILYPWANLMNNFNIDHIYPKSLFTYKKLEKKGIPEEKRQYFMDNVNYIGNLQLLEETSNKEKKDKEFDKWLSESCKEEDKLKDYKQKHYIPNVDISFENFEQFFKEREKLIKESLKKSLI